MIPKLIDPDIRVYKIRIGHCSALVLSPRRKPQNAPGVLWIHGGGYFVGMKEMVWMSRAVNLVKKFGAVVVAPGYRLAIRAPYPAPATKTESNQPNNPKNRANWLIINLYLAKRGLFTILLAENKYKCYHQDCSTTESFILFSFSSTQERK